jgi:cytosine deaminase
MPATDATERTALVLRGGRVLKIGAARPEPLDVAISASGKIARIAPAIEPPAGIPTADISGRLVVPGLVDAHQHLDKTRSGRDVANPDGSLAGAIRAFQRFARGMAREDVMARAEKTIEACLRRGTVAIRTHVNVGPETELRGIEALNAVRERLAGRMTLQIAALLAPDAARSHASARGWLEDAIVAGADAIGGAPANADDPDAFLRLLFDAAERRGVPIDLHLDEHLDAARHRFREVIDLTKAAGLQGRVVAGHCSALGALPGADARRIIEGLAAASIGVVTLPAANLYLLGREADCLHPRGLTRVKALIEAGVPVAAASDNIQDAFVPVGTGDLLEIARWTMLAAHFDGGDFDAAFRMVTSNAAGLLGLSHYGLHEGARADLLITSAEDPADLIAGGPLERVVLVGGQVAAGDLPRCLGQ